MNQLNGRENGGSGKLYPHLVYMKVYYAKQRNAERPWWNANMQLQ